jgi:flagellar hook assembly protein FlgD
MTNPYRPNEVIRLMLARGAAVDLTIYNVQGMRIRDLLQGDYEAGTYEVVWDGRSSIGEPVSSGVYYFRVKGGDSHQTSKVLLIR